MYGYRDVARALRRMGPLQALVLLGLSLLLALGAPRVHAATQFSTADYDLYVGDFNGDGKADILYIAKSPDKPSGIALADANGVPQMGFQSWPSDYLNIPWSSGAYKAIVGDFNGDGCSDILLQAQTPGDSYVLLANCNAANGPVGQITGISQTIPESYLGLNWSADQHQILAGDFDGDGKTDLLLQATTPGGTDAIVLADTNGGLFTRTTSNCWAGGPQQCWTDGYEGFNWSTKAASVYVGDFNGDTKSDLLIISKPTWIMINYDVPFPVPKFPPQGNGILLAQPADSSGAIFSSVNQLWNYNALGANFSPLITNVIVGDFNGDGYSDILLQSKQTGRSNLLLYSAGSSGQLGNATTPASNVAGWTGNAYRMLAGNFGNAGASVLYLQATSASGTNYYTSNLSQGSVTAYGSSLQIAANATAPATGVGATAGAASVTASGTGEYTIPLTLPRGTAGMTPELALQYQSSTPDGLLGVGWGISGLSVITRCAETVAQDGVAQGVQYLASDQYCLDGNRLRLIPGTGNQGAAGSEYRTELETYSLIIAVGSGANGPQSFEVLRKDGRIEEYGATADSNIPGTNGTRVWALNQIRDRAAGLSSGNEIDFSYTYDTANGSYRPNQITYAGNSAQGTSPPYTIQFSYQARNAGEVLTRYYVGQQITEVNRLSEIQVLYAGTAVRSWTLGYDTTVTPTHASRITSIQECGENHDCFRESTFTWSTQQFSDNLPVVGSTGVTDYGYVHGQSPYTCPTSIPVDLDGDGIPDTLYTPGSCTGAGGIPYTLYWGTPKNQPARTPLTLSNVTTSDFAFIGVLDLDGDGKQDVLFENAQAGLALWWIHQNADGSVVAEAVSGTAAISPIVADVNGDGYPDLVYAKANDTSHIYVRLHNTDGSAGFQPEQIAWTAPSGTALATTTVWPQVSVLSLLSSELTAMDINGDGRQDVIAQVTGGWQVLYANGSGFTAGEFMADSPVPIDLNGDGCTDIAYVDGTTNTWHVRLSLCGLVNGSGLAPAVDTGIPGTPWNVGSPPNVVDLNGDGFQDLVYTYYDPTTGVTTTYVAYSTGTGFSSPIAIGSGNEWADRDGDGLPDEVTNILSGVGTVYSAVGPKSDLMLTAKDGFDNEVSFTYAPLTDPTVYTRGQGQLGGTQDMDGPMYVVKQLQSTDGVGGQYALTYSYAGGHRNVQGRGFLGFATRTITDSRTGFVTTETYNNTTDNSDNGWQLAGTLAERKVLQGTGGAVLSDTVNTWASIAPVSGTEYPYIQSQTVTTYELGNSGTPITTKTTTTSIDNFGTAYDVTVVTKEDSSGINAGSTHTEETYTPESDVLNDTGDWCISRPTVIETSASDTLTNGGQVTQNVNESWDGPHCRITDKDLDVGSQWELDTHYDYDAWNNVLDQVVKATNLPQGSRETTFDYQSGAATPGQFLMGMTNALGQTTKFAWDPALAVKTGETDPNGFFTQWQYDEFGREVREILPDGTGSRRTYSPCNPSNEYCGDSLLRYMVQEDERDVNDRVISYRYLFYDALGRVKYAETQSLGGQLSVVQTLYDARGNVASRSFPYYAGTDAYRGVSYTYDDYNRVTEAQQPTSDANPQLATTSTSYNGLTVTTTDPLGHSRTQVSDAWGDVIQVTDAAGQNTRYTYDGFGHLKSTTDANGNATTLSYTDRGFKLTSSDPDMGSWSYTYDGAGELLTQTDAKGQVTQYHYDALGRMDNRTDPGASSPDTLWSWDSAAGGIGQLGSVTGPNGYSEQYSYGTSGIASGKVTGETLTEGGNTYAVNYGFDPNLGKVQTITYPTSQVPTSTDASGSMRFAVWYDYQNGYVKDVKDYSHQSAGTVYWSAGAQDARGHITQESYGNGQVSTLYFDETDGRLGSITTGPSGGAATQNLTYTWDADGNLISRADGNQGLTEVFAYDPLNRLSTVTLNGTQALSVGYDAIGNITSKSDVGAYDYTSAQSGCTYTGLTAQPHAVRNAGGTAYCYDADGNLISRGGASVSWYPYNQPLTITQGGGNYSTFYYAPDRSRYRQTSLNGSVTEDRFYVAGLFEQLNSGGTSEYRNYIVVNGEKVAIRLLDSATDTTDYLHDDHLGSTDAITNQAGKVVIRESFDAWGKRRGSAWTGAPSSSDLSTIGTTTQLGFTGQEELDNLSLVDLNGRVYDPAIARFMSADPEVQAPYDSQSFNRYSYTLDNPLNATDPTGFECTGSNIASAGLSSTACSFTNQPGSGYLNGMPFGAPAQPTAASHTVSTDARNTTTGQQSTTTPYAQQQTHDQAPTVGMSADGVQLEAVTLKEPSSLSLQFIVETVDRNPANQPEEGEPPPQDVTITATRLPPEASGGGFGVAWQILGGNLFNCLLGEPCSGSQWFRGGVGFAAAIFPGRLEAVAAEGLAGAGRTVIGKLADLKSLGAGERTLLDRLPNLGSPKANWLQNSSVLRQEMSVGRPIRDASVDAAGRLINNTGFLRAERNLLETHGWMYDRATTLWSPPVGP